jgi:hypothetical protein
MPFLRFLRAEPIWYYGLTLASTVLPPAFGWWLTLIPVGLIAALLWVRP